MATLLSVGANVIDKEGNYVADNEEGTMLYYAIKSESWKMVKPLLEKHNPCTSGEYG